jgi:hypothetical protein
MPDVNITISDPVLISGQYFSVRYRIQSGSWTDLGYKTNAQFTIYGLTAGIYELEVRVDLGGSPTVLCEPVSYFFTVEEEYACPEIEGVEIVRDGQQSTIEISGITVSSPYPCGYYVKYRPYGGSWNQIFFSSLPSSITIPIPTPPSNYQVIIEGVLCDGNATVECYYNVIEAPTVCIPGSITGNGVSYFMNGQGQFFMVVPFSNSTPPSAQYTITWQQYGTMISGLPDSGGTQNFNAVSPVYVPINPNLNIQPEISGLFQGRRLLRYTGNIMDDCGIAGSWDLVQDLDEIIGSGSGSPTPAPTEVININVNNLTIGAPLVYSVRVRERATSVNIAQNGESRTIASGSGNVITSNAVKNYSQYDMQIALTTAPYAKA